MENNAVKTGHPKGLYFLLFTEMWERFSYYGMRAIFILFMTDKTIGLSMKDADASEIYGSYTGLVYLTPLLGGYLCDKFLGNRRSIVIGGLLMAIGQFFMFFSASVGANGGVSLMWMGLTAIIIGNGFFKPNISTMVGQLYPANDRRIDSAFTIFYMGINLGAFFSPLVCGSMDFKWGFLAAGVGMLIGLVAFVVGQKKYLISEDGKAIGLPVKKLDVKNIAMIIGSIAIIFFMLNFKQMFKSDVDIISYLIYGAMVAMPVLIFSDKSLTKIETQRITVIFILAFFVIFFWGAFEQAGASLTLFADRQTERTIFGWEMPASYFQSVNPLAVIALAPIMTIVWGFLYVRKLEPSSPKKMAIGLGLVALGYVVIAIAVKGLGVGEKVSMWWLIGLYIIHTIGELCLSPIGLSMVSKLAPLRLSSLMMGTWFLANAAANKFAGTLSALIPGGEDGTGGATSFLGFQITNLYEFFILFIIMSGAAAAILFVLSSWLEKRMHNDHIEGQPE
ncbi:MAG: peptide MFS transporter [Flavobacterium sp.]|jgi:POT family proton-dependent oligopeptide transporter|uniref:peptide MFS transporter n=1 Tax=Flavobacterium sp. TaxID=239 RepID=UPI0022C2CFBE|nr:peptide MFS transporter [Flavobacterium sp.]MCZ8169147.1 peptide MFS transporter [Flavobacterium sp.]MCZ8298115.1 peptide MFS transporter [Flavobacterium sp.]